MVRKNEESAKSRWEAGQTGDFSMVALEFNWLYYTLVVFLSALIPGVALGWPFLKKSELSVLEKLLLCFFIGLAVPPAMLLLENIFGLQFSLFLVFINIFLVTAAGILWGIKESAFSFKLPNVDFENTFTWEFARKHAASALLLAVVLFAFWIRLQSFSPVYSELDPYFYVYGSGQIIREGEVPRVEDTAWWPEVKMNHRGFTPLKMYIEAQWYALHTAGAEYNNYLLFTTSSWLPPIMAALMALGAYFLFSSYYSKRYGILAAALTSLIPVTLFKMSAGVNEAAPEGMAAVFLVLGIYAIALKKNDLHIGILAGLAFFMAILASNYISVILIPITGFIALQAIDYFIRNQKHDGFLKITAILVASALIANFVSMLYTDGIGISFVFNYATQLFMCVAILALAFGLQRVDFFSKMNEKKRYALLFGAVLLGLLVLIIPNPLGKAIKGEASNYIGMAGFEVPLTRTIAEQNQAGASFEGEAGFLALVPKNYINANPAGIIQIMQNWFFGVADIFAVIFTAIGNTAMQLANYAANILLGTNITTVAKADSLLFFFLVVGSAGLVWEHFFRKGEERNMPSIAILMLLLILPITYIGLNKIKYTIFVGMALAVVAVAALAESERIAHRLTKKIKKQDVSVYVGKAFAVLIALLVIGQAILPSSYQMMIFSKSFEMRYQDDPVAVMPKLAAACEELRAKGYYDAEICAAGYNESFANDINTQFDSKVCLVSQLSMTELFPGQTADEQRKSGEAKAGASFRCNRLADYWVDSMEWIRNNVPSDGRVTSWWDYGHWINYFGDKKTVLRNEHASKGMIGRVAHDYIIGSTQDLIDSMNYFDSQYVLFDVELIGGGSFGGKYGALNYLGCAHEGETSVRQAPGTSKCEFDHSPERILVPKLQTLATTCTISESQQRTGVLAYRLLQNGNIDQEHPAYCIGDISMNGQTLSVTHYLDRKDETGDLEISKGFMRQIEDNSQYGVYEMVYNELPVWPGQNGTTVGGMEDAKTKFYTSNLYKGFYLESLSGFDLVYKSKNGEVKIYKMKDSLFKGNQEGWIDPVTSVQTQ